MTDTSPTLGEDSPVVPSTIDAVQDAPVVAAAIALPPVFETYAAALLPFFVLVVGGLTEVVKNPHAATILPFLILVLGTALTYVVPLLPSGWQGVFKTGVPIVTTVIAALVVYAQDGTLNWGNSAVIIVGALSALATEFGVQIRTKSQFALAA